MMLQQLLNADMATLGRWMSQGLSWWSRELTDILPARFRQRSGRKARWLAELSAGDGAISLWRHGVLDEVVRTPSRVVRSADLVLPPGSVLVRELDLPRVSSADLDKLVELNIDRYTPFTAEKVYFDTRLVGPSDHGAKQRVRLGVICRDRGQAAVAHASAMGLKVERLGVGTGLDGRTLEFDFMRVIRAEAGGDPAGRRRSYLWTGCAVFVALNLSVAIGRDISDVATLRRLVDDQQPTVALALRLRRTVAAERAHRVALLTQRSVHEPLRILDATTRALPKGQWVQRLEWNGHAVRLVGFKRPDFDPLAALRGPALANPRSLLSDMPTKTDAGDEPFDIMADAAVRSPE